MTGPRAPADLQPRGRGRPSLLIAVADPVVISMLSTALSPCFEIVAVARDAEAAIALATEHQPDLAVVDVELPGGGLRVTRELLVRATATAVVALSGETSAASPQALIEADAITWVLKGAPDHELALDLHRAIEGHTAAHAGTEGGSLGLDAAKSPIHSSAPRAAPITVLVVDDEEVVRTVVTALLTRNGYDVLSASNGKDALAVARERRPDAVVLDVEMPDLDGYDVTRQLRLDERTSAIPVLLLTGRSDGADVARGFAAGGDDYLRKPYSSEELQTRVGALIERRKLIDRLTERARTDVLTGLCNRRAWEEELPRELARGSRYGHPIALAILDLDHFKHFNDERGHAAGDSLLRELGAAWQSLLRDVDLLARWGGEEFALLLPNCRPERALAVVERLRATVPMGQTCSGGIAAWDGHETGQQLLQRADDALYAAKEAGRDRVEVGLRTHAAAPARPA